MVDDKTRLNRIVQARATTRRPRSFGGEIGLVVGCGLFLGILLAVYRDTFWAALFLPLIVPAVFLVGYVFFYRWEKKRELSRHWETESELDEQRRTETLARIEEAKRSGAFDKWDNDD